MQINSKLVLALMVTGLSLTGCAEKQPSVSTNIKAAQYLNPNIYKNSSPVVLVLYQLKSSKAFSNANFFSLYSDADKTLGPDLLDKRELEVRPSQSKEIKQMLSPNTAFIGVLAAYRNPDLANWRQIIPISPGSKEIKLDVTLQSQSVLAKLK